MTNIPFDIKCCIIEFLDLPNVYKIAILDKEWHSVFMSEIIWYRLAIRNFGFELPPNHNIKEPPHPRKSWYEFCRERVRVRWADVPSPNIAYSNDFRTVTNTSSSKQLHSYQYGTAISHRKIDIKHETFYMELKINYASWFTVGLKPNTTIHNEPDYWIGKGRCECAVSNILQIYDHGRVVDTSINSSSFKSGDIISIYVFSGNMKMYRNGVQLNYFWKLRPEVMYPCITLHGKGSSVTILSEHKYKNEIVAKAKIREEGKEESKCCIS